MLAAAVVLGTGIAVPAASFADNASGCDFAASGTTQSCSGPLAGSTFAGGDGNLLASPPTFGSTDWQNVSGLNAGIDQPSGPTDNAFGQGTKEDNPNVTVVDGSIPPNKSDLTRFYEASEFANGSNFLYLAWERSNVLGNANMDFEINQQATKGLTGTFTGPITLNRQPGDLLVSYDFTNGGGRPTLGLDRWLTSATNPVVPGFSTNVCLSSSSFPCWGDHKDLNSSNSIGAVNNLDPVTDPIANNASLPALTFGEAAINLTAAGVFPSGTCEAFGSAFLKSRASSSFTSEVKDFVAPVAVNISNCGTIKITKKTENGNNTFNYTTTGNLSPGTFTLSNGQTQTYGPNTVPAGNYSVTESAPPSGWTLKSLTCNASGSGTTDSVSGATASITIAPQGEVDCLYVNHTNLSPTIATTLSETTGNIGDTVTDSAKLTGATADAGGMVTYTVYSDSSCTAKVADGGTVTVTNGTVPDSNQVTFSNSGTFFWQASYTGDANNNPATSACTSEKLIIKTSPSIATTLSATTADIGGSVTDSAKLTGATADAGGMVTYTVFSDSSCTAKVADGGTVTVTNGTVPDSNPVMFNSPGTFFWQAVYTGDANNNGATSACTSEQLIVKTNPAIVTTLSETNGSIGDSVHDSATLSGLTSDATGNVTYTVYSDSFCTNKLFDAGTKPVTNGTVPDSNPIVFSNAGTFFWQASYNGDAKNNPASSDCTSEKLVIAPNTTGIKTAQHVIPNDDATISGATSTAGGSITFNLYNPSDTTCSGTPAFTQTVPVNGNGTYSTTNTGVNAFVASDNGEWRWLVSYTGDPNNVGSTSACGVENFTITNG